MTKRNRSVRPVVVCVIGLLGLVKSAAATEIWVAPTYQQDLGGLGVASNTVWPATAFGAVRLAWAIPNDVQMFQSARVALIPHIGGAAMLNLIVCAAADGGGVAAACAGPFPHAFTGIANQLIEVDVSAVVGPRVGAAGVNYLAAIAYTTPTAASDHIVGLRFRYAPTIPSGAATLGANTFTGRQTAPSFAGNGASLTNVNANLLDGLNSTQFALAGHTHDVSEVVNAARLTGGNALSGTQSIASGNLEMASSTATAGLVTKNAVPFLHNFGTNNTFLGLGGGNLTMTGSSNTGLGAAALSMVSTGFQNTAVGRRALRDLTTGDQNTAIGEEALVLNRVGTGNTAVGASALIGGGSSSSFNDNTAIGIASLFNVTSGSGNVAVGASAGINATGSNNIYLGNDVFGVNGESNTMYLGKVGTQTKTFVAGVRGAVTGVSNAVGVLIDSNGQLGTINSSRRVKDDIRDMADASERLLKLRPVTFRYKQVYADGSTPIQFGLIAEEVAEVFPELAVHNANGDVETVHYETLGVLLLNEVKRQQQQIDRQHEALVDLEKQIEALRRALSDGARR